MRADQAFLHVVGVAGGIADARQPIDLVERGDQAVQAGALGIVPCVDVLAEQGDLARAGVDQRFRFVDDCREGAADLGTAGVGDDAIGAELVAPFLHRQERGRAGLAAGRERAELGNGGHVGVDRAALCRCLGDEIGQVVIGLRADDDIDLGAMGDLLALGLRDAAGDGDHRIGAVGKARVLPQPANVRIDLLGRLFADVAGVEDDQIGAVGVCGGGHALCRHQLGHALAVIDVHLAAEGFDVIGLGGGGHGAGL